MELEEKYFWRFLRENKFHMLYRLIRICIFFSLFRLMFPIFWFDRNTASFLYKIAQLLASSRNKIDVKITSGGTHFGSKCNLIQNGVPGFCKWQLRALFSLH
jgi:hypothetical protein